MSHRCLPTTRIRRFALFVPILVLTLGCASTSHTTVPTSTAPSPSDTVVPATPSGRYTLVVIAPDEAQRDLMKQVIDVTVPRALPATVADMLRYVLLRSGFSVCESDALVQLEALPLPAAHFHLGPITLRDALQVLAGPNWRLMVDETTRQVCFASSPHGVAAISEVTP